METTVEKLEAMVRNERIKAELVTDTGRLYVARIPNNTQNVHLDFQKSEADLDYIEKRLKMDFINANHTGDGAPPEENLVGLLEYLGPIKAKHAALSTQVKEIAAAHKESMDSIRSQLDGTLQLIQHFKQTGNAEISPLTQSEQEASEICAPPGPSQITADEVTPVVNQQQQQHKASRTDRLADVS